ncbi:MAG: O-acetylhomoserine aminocarboxypropyltransferase/cysteine synthase [bacterium]|nr:O-acetylhomoserine aminocarboxypropyltransferase/cysteine synthase [bacterium]
MVVDTEITRFERYLADAREAGEKRAELRRTVRGLKFDTIAVHGMYSVEEAFSSGQGGIIEGIYPSTSQAYRDSDEMEAGLSYQIPTWCYSRIHNPTVYALEETLALLESYGCEADATALCTSSGMSAIKQAVEPFLAFSGPGEPINFVAGAQVYGGTFQLFNIRMRERGATARWVKQPWQIEEWEEQIDDSTRFLYAEMPSNPTQVCFDIKAVAELAHKYEIPLIVDSTVATPALLRPLEHGADIVVQSLTKTIGSGGFSLGGALIARHNLVSRHLEDEARADFGTWVKLWPFRDSGPCMSPYSAFLFLNDLRSLRMKVEVMSKNTFKVAQYLDGHAKVESVDYLGLPNHQHHQLASRYLKMVDDGAETFGHLMAFTIRGSAEDTRRFFDGLIRVFRATDLGRIKSVATIPAISTHQQQGEEGRDLAGIPPTMVRLCVGAEHPDDVIADLDQALAGI